MCHSNYFAKTHNGRSIDDYETLHMVSRGSYGVVYAARDTATNEIVAVKQLLKPTSESTFREIGILKSLPRGHPSIIDLKHVFRDDLGRVFLVMEYLDNDLARLITSRTTSFELPQLKAVMRKILEGVSFLHERGVMHRDLKPANILISEKGDRLKICDFRLSRSRKYRIEGSRRRSVVAGYTDGVGTRWYKAPELLLGVRTFSSFEVDMWSVGCIMAELVLNEALFRGDSDAHQLWCIKKILQNNLLRRKFDEAAAIAGAPQLTDLGFDLLERLLTFDHKKRITAKEALNHQWFLEN